MAALMESIEIRTAEYRPCYVDGMKALFHRWTEKDRLLIKIDDRFAIKPRILKEKLRAFEQRGFVDAGLNTEHVRQTLAIVEYEDGTIDEVEPCDVRFVPGIMNEYNFMEGAENEDCNATD